MEYQAPFCKIVCGVLSPLLANIVLNHLDWQLHDAGFRFARYADDFVVVCQDERQAQEALALVQRVLESDLRLTLSPEKTKIATYGRGYEFLGGFISSCSRRMCDKSVRKFKAKVRELTVRHHNVDSKTIAELNQVIRGTAKQRTRNNCRATRAAAGGEANALGLSEG